MFSRKDVPVVQTDTGTHSSSQRQSGGLSSCATDTTTCDAVKSNHWYFLEQLSQGFKSGEERVLR